MVPWRRAHGHWAAAPGALLALGGVPRDPGCCLAEHLEHQLGESVVQARHDDHHEDHESHADHRVGDKLLTGWPDHLAKLADHLPEEQRGGSPGLALGRAPASAPLLRGLTACLSCQFPHLYVRRLWRSPDRTRRAGGTRTPNRRFWRPGLYQLSYCPRLIYLASASPAASIRACCRIGSSAAGSPSV